MILVYAFANRWSTNVSSRVLMDLIDIYQSHPGLTFQKIYGLPHRFFQKYIVGSAYSLIIGLGDYYGPLSQIKLETKAKNQYGTNPILPLSPITLPLSLPPGLILPSGFCYGYSMGTYNCNWMAYSIEAYFNRSYPVGRQLFFHLPPKSTATHLAANLADFFELNRVF
ncbi:MAG: hypothetical protein WCT01_02385 [Candidatus Shapirobacteria bacterium]|jgi:hypothetical protein